MIPSEASKTRAELFTATQKCSDNIKALAIKEQEHIEELAVMNISLEKIKSATLGFLTSETENGKRKYGNDTAREVELNKRLAQDMTYQNTVKRKKTIGKEYGLTKINKEAEERQFKIWLEALRS